VNSDLEELVMTDPYTSGWLIEIRMSDDSELAHLMSSQDYKDFLAELS
jgi:glycine cleavage system H lipoate-binding protein